MSAIKDPDTSPAGGGPGNERDRDPRAVRSRKALLEAARTLFLREGYAAATMEEIAELAGLTKRTVYNHFADKEALFTEVVREVIAYAEAFARELRRDLMQLEGSNVRGALDELGPRLAVAIVRPEVVALRRLLVGEARRFPGLAAEYFDRAPGRVLAALASEFERLGEEGVLRIDDARTAAAQFAYLVAGAPLDRAILIGMLPSEERLRKGAREGVRTFLARYYEASAPDGTRVDAT